ncbi:MAG: DUF1788 domain-containing protein [Syntrophomonas sp.]
MPDIRKRLDAILPEINKKGFIESAGQGGEIGFYIFDYDPRDELLIRSHVPHLIRQLSYPGSEIHPLELDLYALMLEVFEDKRVTLTQLEEVEAKQGRERLFKIIKPMLKPENFIDIIMKKAAGHNLVFITGVGKVWPFVRSHTILNNLHSVLDTIPVILFFPGAYDQRELMLFKKFKDDNYYRAFKLVD